MMSSLSTEKLASTELFTAIGCQILNNNSTWLLDDILVTAIQITPVLTPYLKTKGKHVLLFIITTQVYYMIKFRLAYTKLWQVTHFHSAHVHKFKPESETTS